ncbi:MAG: hypothetical protein AAGN35_23580 [Bacteroidota bacterium]
MPRKKAPFPTDREFVNGPDLGDPQAVLTWIEELQAQPETRNLRLRLPVTVLRDASGVGEPNFVVGARPDLPPEAVLELYLDDTRLGIPLRDRIATLCPRDPAAPCMIVVEGTWGPLIDVPDLSEEPTLALTHVLRFEGDAQGGNETLYISREKR